MSELERERDLRRVELLRYLEALEELRSTPAYKVLMEKTKTAQLEAYHKMLGSIEHDMAMKMTGLCFAYGEVLAWMEREIAIAKQELMALSN